VNPRDRPVLYAIDLEDCRTLGTVEPEALASAFAAALQRAGATVVQALSHMFPETGLTIVLVLSESHAVLHTWPETGMVNIDIFSCSTRLKSLEAVAELSGYLGSSRMTIQEIERADGHRRVPPQRGAA
jgi:S-adenosylmethionine decarboxylase